ncbi:hypothetical protein E2C01_039448 [Portunus trituberculatus]|uniref:Uncharacterized protein n=1 Tax=Portunus trituberculatus TaxID=210409 RepID=A0A5B7FGV6_PORTR|nr:hypothetical protein [Portunus trituberculatus]
MVTTFAAAHPTLTCGKENKTLANRRFSTTSALTTLLLHLTFTTNHHANISSRRHNSSPVTALLTLPGRRSSPLALPHIKGHIETAEI